VHSIYIAHMDFEFVPVGGWNPALTAQERIQCMSLFFFLKNKKRCNDTVAGSVAMMSCYKQKYGVTYEADQERMIAKLLIRE
jgi:hypothetical protein